MNHLISISLPLIQVDHHQVFFQLFSNRSEHELLVKHLYTCFRKAFVKWLVKSQNIYSRLSMFLLFAFYFNSIKHFLAGDALLCFSLIILICGTLLCDDISSCFSILFSPQFLCTKNIWWWASEKKMRHRNFIQEIAQFIIEI